MGHPVDAYDNNATGAQDRATGRRQKQTYVQHKHRWTTRQTNAHTTPSMLHYFLKLSY